jgi:hypothetical protein
LAVFVVQCVVAALAAYGTIKVTTTQHLPAEWQWLADALSVIEQPAYALGAIIQRNARDPDPARYVVEFLIYLAIFRLLTALIRRVGPSGS